VHDSSKVTLRNAWQAFHRTADHAARYVEDVEDALAHWERCGPNPPIEEIGSQQLHEWKNSFMSTPLPPRGRLSSGPPRYPRPATCAKYLRALQAILATCGPAQHGNKWGRGVIPSIPATRPPKVDESDVVTATMDELSAIYRHCEVARWPQGPIPADKWWRALLVYLFNIGPRRNDLFSLRQTQVNFAEHVIRDRSEKGGKSALKPMVHTLASHLQAIWEPQRTYVFECPNNKRSLYDTWYAIQASAGIVVDRPPGLNRKPYYGFHEIRKTCGTELWLIDQNAATQMLNHSDRSTTFLSYVRKKMLAKTLRPAAEALQQPSAFSQSPSPAPDRPFKVVG
jgi:integrase